MESLAGLGPQSTAVEESDWVALLLDLPPVNVLEDVVHAELALTNDPQASTSTVSGYTDSGLAHPECRAVESVEARVLEVPENGQPCMDVFEMASGADSACLTSADWLSEEHRHASSEHSLADDDLPLDFLLSSCQASISRSHGESDTGDSPTSTSYGVPLPQHSLVPDALFMSEMKGENAFMAGAGHQQDQHGEGECPKPCGFGPSMSNMDNEGGGLVSSPEQDPSGDGGSVTGFTCLPGDGGVEGVEKREARLQRNRESAQLSRQRKKAHVDELEGNLKAMAAVVADLNATIARLTQENLMLRQQLAGGHGHMAVPMAMGPGPVPMGPWLPGYRPGAMVLPPYGARPPPVPLPRLKGRRAATVPAAADADQSSAQKRGADGSGGAAKRLKRPAAAVLALCCFAMVLGPWMPASRSVTGTGQLDRQQPGHPHAGGRVLMSLDGGGPAAAGGGRWTEPWRNATVGERQGVAASGLGGVRGRGQGNVLVQPSPRSSPEVVRGERELSAIPAKPLALPAKVTVPRNNQLVQVHGNLLVQAVMAGDSAAAASGAGGQPHSTVERGRLQAAALKLLGVEDGHLSRALTPLPPANKQGMDPKRMHSLEEAFAGGGAPPASSSVCTEVFRFDTGPDAQFSRVAVGLEGATRAASSRPGTRVVPHGSTLDSDNGTKARPDVAAMGRGRHRRLRYAVPLPPVQSAGTNLPPRQRPGSRNATMGGKVHSIPEEQDVPLGSSLSVSVLSGALESTNDEAKERHFFVVLLVGGSKYVTYSCFLPTITPRW